MKTTEEKFWSKVDRGKIKHCWLWTASTNGRGYGQIQVGSTKKSSHRLSYEINIGPIPEGLCVLHRCDIPLCVNPAHLYLGTNDDNITDKVSKGRQTIGERHPSAKLTECAVRQIRKYYAGGGCTQKWLGQVYGVADTTISRAVSKKLWALT